MHYNYWDKVLRPHLLGMKGIRSVMSFDVMHTNVLSTAWINAFAPQG